MKIKILLNNWDIVTCEEEEMLADTSFPERTIRYNLLNMKNKEMYKHCILHELTHAIQFETGQSQNIFNNGKRSDDFDSEYIAEFTALYASYILELYEKYFKDLYKKE